jgi:hypothetical protein
LQPRPQVTSTFSIKILSISTFIRDKVSFNANGNCYAIGTSHDLDLLPSVTEDQSQSNKFGVQHQTATTHG